MGVRDSKPSTITYEDVIKYKRVDESDLNRLREAFRRIAPSSSHISQQVFIREVLGPGVPTSIAKSIFTACGGTNKGIAFKDLVCGLILLTKGTISEKHRFLFDIYSEDGEYIYRQEFEKMMYASESQDVCRDITRLFSESDRISFDRFRDWIISYPEMISASRWLLSEVNSLSLTQDFESPNFYQTLAGVTHLEEQDILDLERAYSSLVSKAAAAAPPSPSSSSSPPSASGGGGGGGGGKLGLAPLSSLLSPPVPASVVPGLFGALDENRDGVVDFKEMACGVSAAARGPLIERQKFCFKVFDKDRDGVLNEEEIRHMVQVLQFVKRENLTPEEAEEENFDEESIVSELMKQCGAESRGLTVEEYLIWSVAHDGLVSHFVNLIFQVCHIVLGLRPSSRQEEGELVMCWLEREGRRGLLVGQYWNLVTMEWWQAWRAYVSGDKTQETSAVGSEGDGYSSNSLTKNNSTSSFKSFTLGRRSAANFLVANSLATDQNETVVTKLVRPLDKPSTHYTHNRTASYHSLIYEPFSPSQSPMLPRKRISKPGPIDNSSLIVPTDTKIPSLTGEGGKLRKNLELSKGREFELLPASLWKVLHSWYGGGPALPRQVIKPPHSDNLTVEYYPVSLNLYRHVFPNGNNSSGTWSGGGPGIIGGYGTASSLISYPYVTNLSPKRHLSNTATLSCLASVQQVCDFAATTFHLNRQDVRLWQILSHDQEDNVLLLEDETCTLEDLGIDNENNNILVEVRNKDLTWPEEINKLTTAASLKQVASTSVPGAAGLNNLGNTCFMNAALQCVSNTRPLTQYFTARTHLYELNRTNPLGMRGHIAKRYGDLVHEIWSGTAKTIAPLKLRLTIGKYAPRFNGFQQHDSQEFLAFLLDGLHEDLNRVTDKPYVELKDSDGRPDEEVAREAWENHILRNRSVVVDLFHGQLKSKVTCLGCHHESVRFDPFNYLSLPLPIEVSIHIHVVVLRLDGSCPIKYGLKAARQDTYAVVKAALSRLSRIPARLLQLAELRDGMIRSKPADDEPVRCTPPGLASAHVYSGTLYAYELPGSGEEERAGIKPSGRDATNFTAIQRTVKPQVAGQSKPNSQALPPGAVSHEGGHVSLSDASQGNVSVNHVAEGGHVSLNLPQGSNVSISHASQGSNISQSSTASTVSHSSLGSSVSDGSHVSSGSSGTITSNSSGVSSSLGSQCNSQAFCDGSNGSKVNCQVASSEQSKPNSQSPSCEVDSGMSSPVFCLSETFPTPCTDEKMNFSTCNGEKPCKPILTGEKPISPGEEESDDNCDSGNCSASSSSLADSTAPPSSPPLVAYHRKMLRQTAYFLSAHKYRPILFGIPVMVPCSESTTHQDLYQAVWLQVSRLVTPLPPLERRAPNHAMDCDDSLGYEYPFVLKAVTPDGMQCCLCPWTRFCLGCKLACDATEFCHPAATLAIDWDPTALHLRYQSSLERVVEEHETCVQSRREQTEPINLAYCLASFTREELLGEDEKYFCPKCKSHQVASKKLEIYRLPPVLIVHLKRFQLVQNKWIKCQKVVNFPHANLDPTLYLASVPKTNILRHRRLSERADGAGHGEQEGCEGGARVSDPGSPSTAAQVSDPQDLHQHRLLPGQDPFHLQYRLYAIVCHSGILGGGHYVAYAQNPNGKWYAYNDSSCRQVLPSEMDTSCAYMLFYERDGLDLSAYLPDVSEREMTDTKEIDEDYDENEMKKVCAVM